MADLDPQTLARAQAQMDADPRVQAILKNPQLKSRDRMIHLNQITQGAIPPGYHLDETSGKITKDTPAWVKYVAPLATIAGGFGGAAALGGMGGAGAAPAAASAAGDSGLAASIGAPAATAAGIESSALPTLAATSYGSGMATMPSVAVPASSASTAGATGAATGLGGRTLNAAVSGLAGLPGLLSNRGPSDQETALTNQIQELLKQQQARTTYQNPLYEAVTQMAYGLLPKRPGGYPGGSLG